MTKAFSVLLPVHRPPIFLPYSMASVLGQDLADLELLLVCDGAPVETVSFARGMAERDPRVRVFEFPKGERNGEAHRARALAEADGRYVAHINDDSLWLPDHLSSLLPALAKADFVNVTHTRVDNQDSARLVLGDLADPELRKRMLEIRYNVANIADVAYSMDAYRRLADGWSPAPRGVWSDLHMWRKFFRCAGLRYLTLFKSTSLVFQRPVGDVSTEAQLQLSNWAKRMSDPATREQFREEVWGGVAREQLQARSLELRRKLDEAKDDRSLVRPKIPDDFDPAVYISLHPDLAKAGVDGREHYLKHGFFEGRRYR